MRPLSWTLAPFILLAGLTLGCPAKPPTPGTEQPKTETPTAKGLPEYYRFPINTPIPELDPSQVTDTVSSSVVGQLFDGLVKINPNGELEANLAESWAVDPDGLVYTFKLRPGLTFHNGRAVTAEDFAYSLDRILNPATASPKTVFVDPLAGAAERMAGTADHTAGIVVVDESTLELRLHHPNALFPWYLCQSTCVVVPKEAVEDTTKEWSNHPVGTGPFMLGPDEYNFNEGITLVANPNYHRGAPKLKGIKYIVEKEEKKRFEGFKAGLYEHTDIPPTEIDSVMGDPAVKAMILDRATFDHYHIAFQCEKPPFKDNPTLRQAFNYAIDKEHIANTLLKGTRVPATGYLPNGFPGYPVGAGYPYNPTKAAELLAQAGYPEGKGLAPIKLWLSSDETHVRIMEAVQNDLSKLGIQVELKTLEWASFLKAMDAGEHELGQTTWLMDYPDPDNIFYVLFDSKNKGEAGNQAFYGNPEVDRRVEEAQRIADPDTRNKLYSEAAEMIYNDAPWILLLNRKCQILKQPYVQGLNLTTLDRAPVIPGVDMETVEFVAPAG